MIIMNPIGRSLFRRVSPQNHCQQVWNLEGAVCASSGGRIAELRRFFHRPDELESASESWSANAGPIHSFIHSSHSDYRRVKQATGADSNTALYGGSKQLYTIDICIALQDDKKRASAS